MKIEMAESLLYSYLKHEAGCRIVQTNWTTSTKWKPIDSDREKAFELFHKIRSQKVFEDIFKKNSFEQLIKQAEIDVLGINTAENEIYGLDVAFHSKGLGYGNKIKNGNSVLKKVIRTIFIMQCYFNDYQKFNSFFICPKTGPSDKNHIDSLIKELKSLIADESINIKFITNEAFYTQIVDPLLISLQNEHDTSELFARAVKLLNVENKLNLPSSREKQSLEKIKIGQFAKEKFTALFKEKNISEAEIQNLLDKNYCKEKLNQNWAVLRKKEAGINDENGYGRYYSSLTLGKKYHLTSQWFDRHWEPLNKWLRELKNKS